MTAFPPVHLPALTPMAAVRETALKSLPARRAASVNPASYVLGNDKCVSKIECDRKDAQGALFPVSELGNQDGGGR